MRLEDIRDPELRRRAQEKLGIILKPRYDAKAVEEQVCSEPNKADRQAEKELQRDCENWLNLRGYLKMTADNAKRFDAVDCRWWGHIRDNRKTGILLPDLFMFDTKGGALFVELKTSNNWQPGQHEMIANGMWHVAWTLDEFERIVKNWEGKIYD